MRFTTAIKIVNKHRDGHNLHQLGLAAVDKLKNIPEVMEYMAAIEGTVRSALPTNSLSKADFNLYSGIVKELIRKLGSEEVLSEIHTRR